MGLAAAAAVAGIASAAVGVGSTLLGGSKASGGAQQSAQTQEAALAQTQANEKPFINVGQGANQAIMDQLGTGQLGTPVDLSRMPQSTDIPAFNWNPTQAGLEQTPGYQFTLSQGLQGVQNAAAAKGLGVSGAALKGAANFATGTANTTYNQQLQNALATYGAQQSSVTAAAGQFQNQFNDYWANQNNRYNQLAGLSTTGANAAASVGTNITTGAGNIGNALQNQGTFGGQGIVGAGNALSNTLNNPQVQTGLSNMFGGGSTIGNNFNMNTSATNPAEQAYANAVSSGSSYNYAG